MTRISLAFIVALMIAVPALAVRQSARWTLAPGADPRLQSVIDRQAEYRERDLAWLEDKIAAVESNRSPSKTERDMADEYRARARQIRRGQIIVVTPPAGDALVIGDAVTVEAATVRRVLSPTSILAVVGWSEHSPRSNVYHRQLAIITGIDASGLVDGQIIRQMPPMLFAQTMAYTAPDGDTITAPQLEAFGFESFVRE